MSTSLWWNSVAVAAATAGLALLAGVAVAVRVATAGPRWRSWLVGMSVVALALPPFLVVNTWLDLMGASGLMRTWLPGWLRLQSLGGTVLVLAAMYWPVATLLVIGAWDRVEAAVVEADPRLRGAALWRWVLWPAARSALGLAGLVTFVLAFNQFSIPVILQVPVVSEDLWLALTTRLNAAGAWSAAIPMIVAPVLVLAILRVMGLGAGWGRGAGLGSGSAAGGWERTAGPATAGVIARQLGNGWRRGTGLVTALVLVFSVGLPLAHLLGTRRGWSGVPVLMASSAGVILNTVEVAFVGATLALALGAALAGRRAGGGAVRGGWGGWTWLLFFVPGVLLGQGILAGVMSLGWTRLADTPLLVWLAMALRYAAVGWAGVRLARAALDPALVEAGRLEGARGWRLWWHYAAPQMARPLALTWYAIYLLALWEVETLVLIHPPGGETLALRIFNLLHYGHTADVNAMGLLLLGLALGPLVLGAIVRWVIDLGRGA